MEETKQFSCIISLAFLGRVTFRCGLALFIWVLEFKLALSCSRQVRDVFSERFCDSSFAKQQSLRPTAIALSREINWTPQWSSASKRAFTTKMMSFVDIPPMSPDWGQDTQQNGCLAYHSSHIPQSSQTCLRQNSFISEDWLLLIWPWGRSNLSYQSSWWYGR